MTQTPIIRYPLRAHHSTLLMWAGFSLLVLIGSTFFGLVAFSGNYVLITLAVGLLIGALLLGKPTWNISLLIALGIVTGVLVSMAGPALDKISWGVSILGFLLWVPAIYGLVSAHRIPFFVWLSVFFVLYAVAVTVLRWPSFGASISGFKRYFQASALLVTLATLAFSPRQFYRWKKLVLYIAILQLPFALYEKVVMVPERVGIFSGAQLTDVIAGTFGANLYTGSCNAEMATFVIIAFTFLFTLWQEKQYNGRRLLIMAVLLLTPLFLGETKIVVVMVPLVTLIVLRHDIRDNPARFAIFGALSLLLFVALTLVYALVMDKTTVYDAIQHTVAYNFQNVGNGTDVLNRTTVLTFWWQHQGLSNPLSFLFGNGLGSSYSAPGVLFPGHIGSAYPSYGLDLTAASTLLWDLGLMGLLFYLAILAFAWIAATRLHRSSSDPALRADALAIQSAIGLFVLFTFYRNSGVMFMPWEIVQAMTLGYLGHLVRIQVPLSEHS